MGTCMTRTQTHTHTYHMFTHGAFQTVFGNKSHSASDFPKEKQNTENYSLPFRGYACEIFISYVVDVVIAVTHCRL